MLRKITYMGSKKPWREAIKCGVPSDFHDIVTHTKFCQDWLKGFSVAMGRILAFFIDLLRRL